MHTTDVTAWICGFDSGRTTWGHDWWTEVIFKICCTGNSDSCVAEVVTDKSFTEKFAHDLKVCQTLLCKIFFIFCSSRDTITSSRWSACGSKSSYMYLARSRACCLCFMYMYVIVLTRVVDIITRTPPGGKGTPQWSLGDSQSGSILQVDSSTI